MYPCPTPQICGVQNHREQDNCAGLNNRNISQVRKSVNLNFESASTDTVDLGGMGLSGKWTTNRNGVYSQELDSAPVLGVDKYYHHMASRVELEDGEEYGEMYVRTRSNVNQLPYGDLESSSLSADDNQIGTSTFIQEEDDLSEHVERHIRIADKHNSILRKEQLNPTKGFNELDNEWIPTTNAPRERVEMKKKVILRDETKINRPNFGTYYGEDADETAKIRASVAFLSAYDGRIEARTSEYENLLQFHTRDNEESDIYYEDRIDEQIKYSGFQDFELSDGFGKYKDDDRFEFGPSRVSAPIEMKEEFERAVEEHNKALWGDNVPTNKLNHD